MNHAKMYAQTVVISAEDGGEPWSEMPIKAVRDAIEQAGLAGAKHVGDQIQHIADGLVRELEGAREDDPIKTIEYLSSEACRDLANAYGGMKDLGIALREAIAIARNALSNGSAQLVKLDELEQIAVGWDQ